MGDGEGQCGGDRVADAETEVVRLRMALYEAEHWNQVLQSSFRFRLGKSLVDAVAAPRTAVALPAALARLGRDAFREYRERRRLLTAGLRLPERMPEPDHRPIPGRIACVLHSSLPYHRAGYAVRSQRLLEALTRRGANVHAFTRLGYPVDMAAASSLTATDELPERDIVGPVTYRRLLVAPERSGRRDGFGQAAYLRHYGERLEREVRSLGASVLHAASNYQNGLAAAHAGRRLGIPVIYEVRGLWDESRLAREPEWEGSVEHRIHRRLETQAAAEADHVVTLTGGLKRELEARGIAPERITVVPNAVDSGIFVPRRRDKALADHLGLGDRLVVGYIGSLLHYEGLDLLIRAVASLKDEFRDLALLIVGDGAARGDLVATIRACGLQSDCVVADPVDMNEVPRWYSLVDIAAFPRRGLRVCELVSPLKPLEAMAAGRAVVVSDVAALAEMVDNDVTGLIHRRDDADALAAALRRLAASPDLRRRLGTAARNRVVAERSWDMAAERLATLYAALERPATAAENGR